jgi:alpha-tubulin suppressor-like RCC1 family protein
MAGAEEEQQETVGEVLFCGATDFDTIWSGTRNEKYNDILRPSRISVFMGKEISLVASGPSAAHSVIVAEDGCYTFGYNKWGQLGHGDGGWPTQIRVPTRLPLRQYIIGASCGKTHTWLLTDSGQVFAMGGNDYGQLGAGHKKPLKDPTMLSGLPRIDRGAVGQDFSCCLTEDGVVLACGKPEYGQLGNGTNGEYFVTASKLDFHCETRPIQVNGRL